MTFASKSEHMRVGMRTAPLLFLLMPLMVDAAPLSATFLTDAEVRRAIEAAPEEVAGKPGLYSVRLSAPSESPVIGIRRTAPGRSELHVEFTDVWYVIEGAGTLVTGGTIAGGVNTSPGEVRGKGITDGTSRRMTKGEFAVIPAGMPHWISTVEGKEILYIVVKVPVTKAR